jgi:hypothetical protein
MFVQYYYRNSILLQKRVSLDTLIFYGQDSA